MRVLVACEESQRVCIAFREKGHEAFSCAELGRYSPDGRREKQNVQRYCKSNGATMEFLKCNHLTKVG